MRIRNKIKRGVYYLFRRGRTHEVFDVAWLRLKDTNISYAKLITTMIGALGVSGYKRRFRKSQIAQRALACSSVVLLIVSIVGGVFLPVAQQNNKVYSLSNKVRSVLPKQVIGLDPYIQLDQETKKFSYNSEYSPIEEGAQISGAPKVVASIDSFKTASLNIKDPVNDVTVTMTPKFKTSVGRKDVNQIVYRLADHDGYLVYSTSSVGIKEDIVLESIEDNKNDMQFDYELSVPDGVEARLEANGSIGFYGVSSTLLGNISVGSEKDQELLDNARKNGEKNQLLFTIPAPVANEFNSEYSNVFLFYELEGSMLTLHVKGLASASFPIAIDPSIYVETARKLMRGNSETNVDFDVDNELIQKSQTSGARFDAWQNTIDMTVATWNHGSAANNGYIYRAGGETGPTKPQLADTVTSVSGSTESNSFVMNMPAVRPAGDLYIAMVNHKNDLRVSPPSGGGWTEYADIREHAAYYKIGTDQGGGNEAASYTWNFTNGGDSEEWAGVIMRITNFETSSPISGTAGTGSDGGKNYPIFPATTPAHNATLVVRGAGIDNKTPSQTGWVPAGHTRIARGNSRGSGGRVGFVAASIDTSPLSGVSTGTQQLVEDGTTKGKNGTSTIAVRAKAATVAPQKSVYWAQFQAGTHSVVSPNPGNGACLDWCSQTVYDLPENRVGFSMVAYNGYLYAIGGEDGAGTRKSTVYIAKLGVNGEPSLWHPTDTNKNNWVYWFSDTGLSGGTARSYLSAVAYNNRMYLSGGRTNATPGGVTTMQYADILPNGKLGSWTSSSALPAARHSHSMQTYNDTLYLIGGNNNGTMLNTAHYAKINSDGSLNTWQATNNFASARSTWGGVNTTLIGAYIYITGGCLAVNGSGYCTSIAKDIQLASINADGSLAEWNTILGLETERIGFGMISWQGGVYRIGGCSRQNTTNGECLATVADVDYGAINQDGDASTVTTTATDGVGTCSGGAPYNCDLPPNGDKSKQGGQMASMVVINNGFIYNIGGCGDVGDNDECSGGDKMSGNISYAALSTTGSIVRPSTCPQEWYGSWCVEDNLQINGDDGVGAGSATVFNNTIYVLGGTTGRDWLALAWRVGLNTDGSLASAWSSQTFNSIGMSGTGDDERGYGYAFARANPASAGTTPGNLYYLGGCRGVDQFADGIDCTNYYTEVYKCNIATAGTLSGCTTTGQLQIDSDNVNSGSQGLGIMAGAMYANYLYLVGGACAAVGAADDPCGSNNNNNRKHTIYAKIDNSNNIVDADGETVIDNVWTFATAIMSPPRARAVAFGYNGYLYSLAGYSGEDALQDLLFAKIDVGNGDVSVWSSSGVVVTPRADLRAIVSNGYVYAIGGCSSGDPTSDCLSMEPKIQIFQLYNNDSGAVNNYTAQSDQTFSANTDRWGASSVIYNGYLYVAGGCTSATDCTTATASVEYTPISAVDGSTGTWSAGGSLPAVRAWGSLQIAGGTLYYIGGQSSTSTDERAEVYYTTSITSGNPTWSGTASTNGLPGARTKFGTAAWNNRLYVVGGLDGSATVSNTVYVSPQLNSGGDITTAWTTSTAFNVARTGAAVTAYANNLYLFGGFDGTNYLNDSQFTQINTDGTVDSWVYSTSLPDKLRDARAVSSNGYIYLVGGRSAATTCTPNVLVTPISANTTIATGNNPTGIGEWYETNVKYTGDRYGAAVAEDKGKLYIMGGGCSSPLSSSRHYYSTVKSQPQVAIYSRLIDTDTDVFPSKWLMNGVDNSIGARWRAKYKSMNDTDGIATDCGTADMTTWGQETNFGDVTLGNPEDFYPLDGSGTNIDCARYFFFNISIDASKTFGYPEDVSRGPTINDISLFFTADPSKRLRHGKTFTGGEQQPLDTPFTIARQTAYMNGATFTNDNSIGNTAWTSPGNAQTSNDSNSTAVITSHTNITNYLKSTNFSFNIPSSAEITGIQISTETSASSSSYVFSGSARLVKNGVISGTTKSIGSFLTSDVVTTAGSSNDLWGQTWLPSDINSGNFGFVYWVQDLGGVPAGVATLGTDHVRMTVYYAN